ncbi:MAG: hypothetical protein HY461_02290 [Parcubacteria group bacterium]|nr:hypothetical protein [Parcubacteria group bacterium]
MPRVVSGFKKQRRSRRTLLTYAVMACRFAKRMLSYPIATLPSLRRRQGTAVRPQAYLQRDILRKRLNNPYTHEPKLKRFFIDTLAAQRFRLSFGLLIVVSFAWFTMLFLRPTFYLNRITVAGTQEINPEDIVQMAKEHLSGRSWMLVSHSHRLFVNTEQLAERIRVKYDLDQLQFTAHWPSQSLHITLKEKPSMLVYAVENRSYAVDKNGHVIRELNAEVKPESLAVPVIYDYDQTAQPLVREAVLTPAFIESIQIITDGLRQYPDMHIHSFRIRVSPQHEIRIADEVPQTKADSKKQAEDGQDQLRKAAESIANAQTISEKVSQLQKALKNLEIEKLEEGKLDELLKEERVYLPKEGYRYQELEVYMQEGWSLKLGHALFEDQQEAAGLLNIFATLRQQLDIKEVREYLDLRFANRVYYR